MVQFNILRWLTTKYFYMNVKQPSTNLFPSKTIFIPFCMKLLLKKLTLYFCVLLTIQLSIFAADFHAPAPFASILDRSFSKSWTPSAVSAISNRSHVIILDAESKQYSLSITTGQMSGLEVVSTNTLTDSSATYGKVLRAMFQLQDLAIESQATQSLTGTYSIRPELKIYYGIDANATAGSSTSTSFLINRIKGVDLSDYSNPGYLVFTFSGTPSSAKAQATARYIYDASPVPPLVADPGLVFQSLVENRMPMELSWSDRKRKPPASFLPPR